MQNFEVIFYEKEDGSKPAAEFLRNVEPKMRVKAVRMLKILEEKGKNLREPYSKHLDDGIFELRVKFATDISRILYFFVVDNKIIVTHGFIKKTQKTPPSEIERAKKYREDFFSRKEKDKNDAK